MTETNDDVGPTEPVAPEPSGAARLLALQAVDAQADVLTHQRDRLPERDRLATATDQLRAWDAERTAMRTRIDELGAEIERDEQAGADHRAHKARLEAQLKTVIAPREAEALMHEIASIDEAVDALDLSELEALEEQAAIDDRLSEHLASEESLRAAVSAADTALELATADVDAQLAVLAGEREQRRAELDAASLARYDRIRSSSGVAITRLAGHRCDGCHLDLSAAEVDSVKAEANSADGVAECPSCGRLLVP